MKKKTVIRKKLKKVKCSKKEKKRSFVPRKQKLGENWLKNPELKKNVFNFGMNKKNKRKIDIKRIAID